MNGDKGYILPVRSAVYYKQCFMVIDLADWSAFISGGMLVWLSGMRCRLAYSPADATATHYLLLQ